MAADSSLIIRPATQADQGRIRAIVYEAGINPRQLDWSRFRVADDQGQIVGIGQIKTHRDGSRELASIAVIPVRQGEGIASRIIQDLLAAETDVLYLMCNSRLEGFYQRFGFQTLEPTVMPPDLKRMWRLVQIVRPLLRLIYRYDVQLLIMRRTPPPFMPG
ncbi:MAG: GNAT family N-acetyltransferase [Anaerolineae bacterium]|nr:GNAT family N-acetyltransferase [Anaerolineae bacterium]